MIWISHYRQLEEKKTKEILEKYFYEDKTKFLEIGFGYGKYLEISRRLNYDVTGVELNTHYIERAKENGFNVYHWDDFEVKEEYYDVILLSHVIEHISESEINEFFELCLKLLTKDGKLIILTPLLGDRFYFDITHSRPFYPQSIRHAFGQNNEELLFNRTKNKIILEDIYFFRDPFKTRKSRFYYITKGSKILRSIYIVINKTSEIIFNLTYYKFGIIASWMGVYEMLKQNEK